jgi:hypothetical protein
MLASRIGVVGFLGQYCQRSFQAMREVAGFRQGALDHPFALFQ